MASTGISNRMAVCSHGPLIEIIEFNIRQRRDADSTSR
jgi:hypothetical protein